MAYNKDSTTTTNIDLEGAIAEYLNSFEDELVGKLSRYDVETSSWMLSWSINFTNAICFTKTICDHITFLWTNWC